MIKSERLISITIPSGPQYGMCYQGVQQARDGIDDPPLVLDITYDEPIPEANVEFVSGSSITVFAFPQAIPAPTPPVPVRARFRPQFIKPPWSG